MKQACFLLLELKRKHRLHDTAFDILMRCLAEVLLPEGNILPPSLYLVERLLQSRPPDTCAYHACPKDCKVWPHLPRRDWALHKDDRCDCGAARFVTQTAAGVPCLRPAKVMPKLTCLLAFWVAMIACFTNDCSSHHNSFALDRPDNTCLPAFVTSVCQIDICRNAWNKLL